MKLIHTETKAEAKVGDVVRDTRDKPYVIHGYKEGGMVMCQSMCERKYLTTSEPEWFGLNWVAEKGQV
jgi:hypothetical protein